MKGYKAQCFDIQHFSRILFSLILFKFIDIILKNGGLHFEIKFLLLWSDPMRKQLYIRINLAIWI